MIPPKAASVAVVVSMVWGLAPLGAQEALREVAFVEAVTGRVVALASGAPTLLGPLDVITDRTRVDLLASSEVRICHYLTGRFLTIKGPARIMVSAVGVSVEAGKGVESPEKHVAPHKQLVLRAAWWPGVVKSSAGFYRDQILGPSCSAGLLPRSQLGWPFQPGGVA